MEGPPKSPKDVSKLQYFLGKADHYSGVTVDTETIPKDKETFQYELLSIHSLLFLI
jgi:hypothetical protein